MHGNVRGITGITSYSEASKKTMSRIANKLDELAAREDQLQAMFKLGKLEGSLDEYLRRKEEVS